MCAFKVKGSIISNFIFQILTNDIKLIQNHLEKKKLNNLEFFYKDRPIIIQIEKNLKIDDLYVEKLINLLRINGFITIGLYLHDKSKNHIKIFQKIGIPILNNIKNIDNISTVEYEKECANKNCIIINTRIRSGQQIFSKNGDVVILSKISADAEIIAKNNIFVYGTLKGRAIAGAYGNTNAKIFCNKMEAYLVSIAGKYKLLEKKYDYSYKKNININGFYIYLKNSRISIDAIE